MAIVARRRSVVGCSFITEELGVERIMSIRKAQMSVPSSSINSMIYEIKSWYREPIPIIYPFVPIIVHPML